MEEKSGWLKKIGTNIKVIRKSKNLEVKQVAKELGITVQAYGKIENGITDLNISRLYEIADYFHVNFNELLEVNKGEVYNYTSQNNSGGMHILNKGVVNSRDEIFEEFLREEIKFLKQKVDFLENKLGK